MTASWQPPRRDPDTAYRDTEEARTFLQSRLARFARLAFLISAVFYPLGVLGRGLLGMTGQVGLAGAFGTASTWHLVATGVFLVAWLATRTGKRSPSSLGAVDAVMTAAGSFALEMMSCDVPAWTRPDTFMPLLVSLLLSIRAAVVPSSTRASVAIGAASLAPIPFITLYHYRVAPLIEAAPSPENFALNSVITCALVLVVTGVVSHTVHGLRERVREAMQLGQYTLTEKIGEGGMGIVFKARHALLRRPTAIKLLPPEKAGETNLLRFEREVQITSQLTHPNTISIYDFGRTPEGIFYYAMEYLEGIDLQTLVEENGPQEPARVVQILAQVSGALAEAHSVGLIHRDVKPANIMLCERGGIPDMVKVLDFGLVKELATTSDVSLGGSSINQIIGTPLYLSPEAIRAPSSMDGRSDLYALGAVGYFLLTGEPPFNGSSVIEVCGHHLHSPVVPPSERAGHPLPAELEAIVLGCLEKTADARPPGAAALRDVLLSLDAGASWTPERAAAWWRDHGGALARERKPATLSHTRALRVTRQMAL